jgi:hypothetical protein
MTEEYTVVQLNRQDELTRRIQEKLDLVSRKLESETPKSAPADVPTPIKPVLTPVPK